MEDMTFFLDPETRDLVFDDDGNFALLYDSEAVAQNIRNTLLVWKKEWPLGLQHGTDYSLVMGLKGTDYDSDAAEEAIREAIFQEPEVRQIESLQLIRTAENTMQIAFAATLADGQRIAMEVTTG